MSERKNLDRLFQEKFKDFEVAPLEKVWENIEAELKEKKKRRVIPFWFRLSGVAALLLVGLFIARDFSKNGVKNQNPIVIGTDTIKTEVQNKNGLKTNKGLVTAPKNSGNQNGTINDRNDIGIEENKTIDRHQSQPPLAPLTNKETEKSNRGSKHSGKSNIEKEVHLKPVQQVAAADLPKTEKKNTNRHSRDLNGNNNNDALQNALAGSDPRSKTNPAATQVTQDEELTPAVQDQNESKTAVAQTTKENSIPVAPGVHTEIAGIEKTDTTAVATAVPNALENLLLEKEAEKTQLTTAEPKLNRWQITSNVAPIYFSSASSSGSPLDSRFESNKKSYTPTMAYGAGVQYALTKKLSVRSGISALALEYNTNDLVFFQTASARQIKNVNTNLKGSLIEVDNTSPSTITTLGRTIKQYNGSLTQRTGYLEVPVEMTYKVIDKKFGMEVIGGFSTLFLNQNEISLESSGIAMNIGEATNLSEVHFSTNVGIGFKYSFLKSFQAHIEPTVKYQINTFSSDAGNFKPYFFGLYTGISYRF